MTHRDYSGGFEGLEYGPDDAARAEQIIDPAGLLREMVDKYTTLDLEYAGLSPDNPILSSHQRRLACQVHNPDLQEAVETIKAHYEEAVDALAIVMNAAAKIKKIEDDSESVAEAWKHIMDLQSDDTLTVESITNQTSNNKE